MTSSRSFSTAMMLFSISMSAIWVVHAQSDILEHKSARLTTGTVLFKQHVSFGRGDTFYRNAEGRKVMIEPWRRKSGEDRVYYRMDNLDQVPEPYRSSLVRAEAEREKKFGPRFSIADPRLYDSARPGSTLRIKYRWASDTQLEIISVEL